MFIDKLNLQFFATDEDGGGNTEPQDNEPKIDERSNTSAGTKNTDKEHNEQKGQQQNHTIPYERFKQVNDNLKAWKSLGFDSPDEVKKALEKLAELEKAEEERKRAEMSELDRLKADLEAKTQAEQTLQHQLQELQAAIRQERIRNAFITKAQQANIAYIEDAMKLADLESVEVDEDGTVKGIDDVIKKLVKEKPYLLAQDTKPKLVGNPSNHNDTETSKSAKELLKDAEEKAKRTGKIEDIANYQKLKRELGL